jgi:hypothetical protein
MIARSEAATPARSEVAIYFD